MKAKPTAFLLLMMFGILSAVLLAQLPKLPAPFTTPSVNNSARIVPKPPNSELHVPSGFKVNLFADDVQGPRTMAYAPNGDLFVALPAAATVLILRDTNNDGTADSKMVYAQGLPGVYGIAFHEGYVYFGKNDSVVRVPYKNGDTQMQGTPEKLITLPTGGHSTRNIIFSKDGKKLFVAVGSASNKNAGEDPMRAAISEYNPDGTGHRIFASGLRNPVGMALQPETGNLWVSVNERDTLGDDLVPDYITSVKDAGFYGWPYSYIGSNYDPEHQGKMPDLVSKAIVPDVLMPAHSAAVGITFYTGTQFPQRYQNGAFVGLHGSWNRSKLSGYKVVFVPFQNAKPSGPPEDLVTGWVVSDGTPGSAWGRPAVPLTAQDGSLLVSSDVGNKIWRISYTAR